MGNLCTRPSRSTSGSINIKQNPKLATREDTHTSQDGNQVVVSNTHQAVLGADLDSIRVQYSNSTASTSSTSAQPTKPTLVLLPHQHTLFCERKVSILLQSLHSRFIGRMLLISSAKSMHCSRKMSRDGKFEVCRHRKSHIRVDMD